MANNTTTVNIDFFVHWVEETLFTEEEFEKRKASEIQEMLEDEPEFEAWLNNAYTAFDFYTSSDPKPDIMDEWQTECEKRWEDVYGDDWECITKTIEVKIV